MSLENARALRDMKLYHEAIKVLKKMIRENPKNTMTFNEIAFTYSLMKNHEETITYLNASLHLDQNNAYALYLKGNSLLFLGKVHEAIEEFKKAIAIKQNNVYYNQLGLAYVEVNKFDKAIECYEEAYKINQKNIYKNNIADVYIKMKNFENAKEILLKILEEESEYSIALSNLSECYVNSENYEEALKYINKAIEIENDNVIFLFMRGSIYQDNLKMSKEALNDFNNAYEISQKGMNTGNVFSTSQKNKNLIEQVEHARAKLTNILTDVNSLESELDILLDKIEDEEKKSNLFESLKNLKKEKEKLSENIGLADKIDILENVKAESEKIRKNILEDHEGGTIKIEVNCENRDDYENAQIEEDKLCENKNSMMDLEKQHNQQEVDSIVLRLRNEIENLKDENKKLQETNFSLENTNAQLQSLNIQLKEEIAILKNSNGNI